MEFDVTLGELDKEVSNTNAGIYNDQIEIDMHIDKGADHHANIVDIRHLVIENIHGLKIFTKNQVNLKIAIFKNKFSETKLYFYKKFNFVFKS